MATITTAERDVRDFAAQFPTNNVLRAVALCESGRLTWDQVAGLLATGLARDWALLASALQVGTVVRDTKWDGTYTGTIVNIDGDSIFVQWHGSCVEDQLTAADVTPAPDVPNPDNNGLRLMMIGESK